MGYYDDLTGGGSAGAPAAPAAAPPAAPSYYEELTQGPTDKAPRRVLDDPALGASNLGNVRASLAVDTPTQIKRYADQFGVPESYFGVINGEIVRWVPEENAYAKVVPTMEGQSTLGGKVGAFLSQTSSGFGPALPGIAGTVAGTAMGPTGMSVPVVGGVAAVTDLARQGLDKAIAGENPIAGLDVPHAIGEGAVNAGGQAAGIGVVRALTRNPMGVEAFDRATAMDPARQAEATALNAEAQRRGIDLSTGQATGLRSIMAQERQLGRFPETADQVADFSRNQRLEQVPAAMRGELDQIAPASGREAQIGAFREGADAVVDRAVTQRSAQAQQAYSAALDNREPFWSQDVANLMRRPSMAEAWTQAQRLAAEEGTHLPELFVRDAQGNLTLNTRTVPDWRSWDYMKRGLDAVVEANTNDLGRVNAVGRAVAQTRRQLLGALDAANPDYAAARAAYGTASDAVDTILNGGVGFLRDATGMDRQQIVQRVFSGGNVPPEEIGRMRQQFLAAGRIQDWNAGLRAFLEGHLDRALNATVTGGEASNVPGKLYAGLWGNAQQRQVVTAALGDSDRVAGMDSLMRVLQAASRVLPEGSPTATDLGAGQNAVGTAVRVVGKALSPMSYANIGNELVEGLNALRTPAARQRLADYLLTQRGLEEIRSFRMLAPNTRRAVTAATDLLANAGVVSAGNAIGLRQPSDFDAPAAGKQSSPQ